MNQKFEILPDIELHLIAYNIVTLLCVPAKDFHREVFSTPRSGARYVSYLQEQNFLLISRLAALSYKDVYRRLVARLLYLANHFGTKNGDDITIDLLMTHTQLARSVSSTRETVNKLIKKLSKAGMVSMKSKVIAVHSIDKLAAELETR